MTIIGVAGAIGSGKSFTQLKHGLKYCEERQKQLVTNFPINVDALRQYASQPKEYQSISGYFRFECRKLVYAILLAFYRAKLFPNKPKKPKTKPLLPWVKRLCETGGIIQISSPEKLEALFIPESVILLDEAGILLNSREFAKTSKKLLADLAQSRKDGCDLIWCAQFDEQVDRQLRLLTQFWIHCESLSMYDKKMRRPKLFYKRIFWFRCSDYQEWLQNPRVRGSHIKTRLIYSTLYEGGLLTPSDRKLFSVYDSFLRLDIHENKADINSKFQCKLPRDYYFCRLDPYVAEHDPFCKYFRPLYSSHLKRTGLVQDSSEQVVKTSKSSLVAQALQLSRQRGVKPPYLANMDVSDIEIYINSLHSY